MAAVAEIAEEVASEHSEPGCLPAEIEVEVEAAAVAAAPDALPEVQGSDATAIDPPPAQQSQESTRQSQPSFVGCLDPLRPDVAMAPLPPAHRCHTIEDAFDWPRHFFQRLQQAGDGHSDY